MNAAEILGLAAMLLQLAAAVYALGLSSKSSFRRGAWLLSAAFFLMAFTSATQVRRFGTLIPMVRPEWLQIGGALLLLAGLSRLQTRSKEEQRPGRSSAQLPVDLEARVEERTAELVQANMKLARDLEQRQQMEAELRASRESYRGLIEALDGVVFECRKRDLGFTFISPQSERVFGYSADTVLRSMSWKDLVAPEDHDRFVTSCQALVASSEKTSEYLEFRIRTKSGQIRLLTQLATVVPGKSGDDRIRGILLDVTDRRCVEEEVRQSEKLEAIGRMAGGVAHDLNNSLTVIQGYAQLLAASKGLSAEFLDHIKHVSQASDQAARLTQQLLAFSRKQDAQTEPLNLNAVVEGVSKMLRAIVGEAVSLQLDLGDDLPFVQADPGQLSQVLVNLVVNSRDAMPSGGRLLIQTESVTFGAVSPESDPDVRPGTFVCLAITDSGMGIPAEAQPHIFEPFFTTKGVGKGAGLGLSTVYGIVKQHQGWIRVTSAPNEGTTFRIFLPTAVEGSLRQPAQTEHPAQETSHRTILVVDDEPAVLDLVRSILQSHGYEVLSARSGLAALKLWNDHDKNVDLLLTDLVMPDGLSGLDLLGHLREDRPELRAILMSGYASPELSLSGHTAFIQKPYRPATLLKTVHDCLENEATAHAE